MGSGCVGRRKSSCVGGHLGKEEEGGQAVYMALHGRGREVQACGRGDTWEGKRRVRLCGEGWHLGTEAVGKTVAVFSDSWRWQLYLGSDQV